MHPYYDYHYCCKKLEKVGRAIRDQINADLPVAFTDVTIMGMLGGFDLLECPFCEMSTEETYERMRLEWNDRHPTANLHFNTKRREE